MIAGAMDDDLLGRTLAGRYDILAMLGKGGMGAVYRARDRELDEEIALKVLRTDRNVTVERFRREVKLARRVTHRNVARTFELVHADGVTFCTMELVDGESLRKRLRRDRQIGAEQAIAIARELCEGLVAAHAAGVIHRDIKPENVLIASDGRVVLADFGIAAAVADDGEVAGTDAYMAPEQARGEAPTPAADIYAVGIVLFEMVTGTLPARGAEIGERELARVVARATAPALRDRIGDARELAHLLDVLGGATASPPSAPPGAPDEGLAVRTVIVTPARAADDKLALALALHEQVLAELGGLPRIRAVPRLGDTVEPADAVVELVGEADVIRATIRRPASAATTLVLPLAVAQLTPIARAIAAAVAGALDAEPLSPSATRALELALTARERFQRGLHFTREAHELLDRAYALWPDDPRIIAPLAMCEVRMAFFFEDAHQQRLARARNLVRAALEHCGHRVETHLAAGHLALHSGRPVAAAVHFRDAISRAPHVAEPHDHLGRMLLEAGFLDAGYARIADALARAPQQSVAGWELARAHALEGQWQDYDRLEAELVATGVDRWVMRLRADMWRRDLARLARTRAIAAPPANEISVEIAAIADTILANSWHARRDELVATATASTAVSRRRAFDAQLAAEVAGYFDDADTCAAMIAQAAEAGTFDLHWLDRCPLLECARGSRSAEARAVIARRANAIHDALYRDAAPDDDSATTMS